MRTPDHTRPTSTTDATTLPDLSWHGDHPPDVDHRRRRAPGPHPGTGTMRSVEPDGNRSRKSQPRPESRRTDSDKWRRPATPASRATHICRFRLRNLHGSPCRQRIFSNSLSRFGWRCTSRGVRAYFPEDVGPWPMTATRCSGAPTWASWRTSSSARTRAEAPALPGPAPTPATATKQARRRR